MSDIHNEGTTNDGNPLTVFSPLTSRQAPRSKMRFMEFMRTWRGQSSYPLQGVSGHRPYLPSRGVSMATLARVEDDDSAHPSRQGFADMGVQTDAPDEDARVVKGVFSLRA